MTVAIVFILFFGTSYSFADLEFPTGMLGEYYHSLLQLKCILWTMLDSESEQASECNCCFVVP